ncbi:MAG: ABC transporter permease subunit [Rhodobacteraceae bacterium]|nr:ABC transporter permease subunit [Paracoccaceae bacterium]
MTMATDSPRDGFRLSMLIYDSRYRALTIQLFVLALFIAVIWWLGSNLQNNLAEKGRPLSFDFLWSRAGYDIAQTLIPYTNDSTHFRAMLVGLVNTLVLAFFGCIFATIIGVIVGVLRLSKNWLIARLMTIYVEIFRNIPLLLWILLIFVPLGEMTPAPNAFRLTDEMVASGTLPAASMLFGETVAITNRGTYIPGFLFDRGFESGWLTTLVILAVILGSLFVHFTLTARARRVQEDTGVRPTTWWKSLAVLFLPLAALLWAMGFHLDIPQPPTRFNFEGGVLLQNAFVAMLVALSLYTGAFIAEIVRAGILAVSRGQTEAAYALGLRPNRTMRLVVLPQALRVIIPPLISQFLNLTKNTSLGIAASYADLRGTLGGVTLNQTGREVEAMLLMMLIYLSISLSISALMNVYNRSVQLKER